jgi:hypothetical protein
VSRWIWRTSGGVWLLAGALAIPLLFATWRSSPGDDVDYDPMARVFFAALVTWIAVGLVLLVAWLLYRAAQHEASLKANDPDAAAR